MRRVHVIGRKNSGKTTLIVELVQCLTQRGCRVATIKHTHHHHELDTPGKDSQRHRMAGAAVVAVVSPKMTALFRPSAAGQSSQDRYDWLRPAFDGCDLVLVEGDSQTQALRVEVWRAAVGSEPMAATDTGITAIITDDPHTLSTPSWPRGDVERLAELILGLAR